MYGGCEVNGPAAGHFGSRVISLILKHPHEFEMAYGICLRHKFNGRAWFRQISQLRPQRG